MPVKQQTGDNPGQRQGLVQWQTDEVGVVLKNCNVSVCYLHPSLSGQLRMPIYPENT